MLNPELKLTTITPDAHGDWLNQRRDDFGKFIGIDGKKNNGLAVFSNFSMGIVTSRDSWCFNASKRTIEANFKGCIGFYNEQVNLAASEGDSFERNDDPSRISWSRSTKRRLLKKIYCPDFDARLLAPALYRPFVLQNVYMEPFWIEAAGQISSLFPFDGAQNLAIGIASIGASSFSCLISNRILDFHVLESGTQCLPRYLYRPVGEAAKATKAKTTGQADLFAGSDAGELDASNGQSGEQVIINGYVREDAIKPEAVAHFRAAYAGHEDEIDADSVFYYIYGILHSKDYRETYANNLQKELPRIPRVASFEDFKAFENAGRALADLHVNYEQVEPYDGCKVDGLEAGADASCRAR